MAESDRLSAQEPYVGDGNELEAAARSLDLRYELRFRSLNREGRGWAFPCDAAGHVDMDSMSDRARNNYMFARALIGIEVAAPCVQTAF